MPLPLETTPTALTPKIGELCRGIVPNEQPIFVPMQPCEGAVADCLENVARYAAQFGGSSILGWRIWERSRVNVHAEFYAVWKAPNGQLLDVSPKPDGETKILFLPDLRLVWEGKPIPGRFLPLIQWREIQDYLAADARLTKVLQAGLSGTEHASARTELKRAVAALEKRLERSK